MDETPKSRQENELEVLCSIYCEDIKDLRTGTKWKPLDLLINLKPQQGSISTQDIHVNVNLHIVCPPQYPIQSPQISLENAKGLSQSVLNELRSELVEIARKHKGSEVILELCQYVQEYLYKHNKPSSKSFYDEMLQRRMKEEMQNQQAKQLEEDLQRKKGEEEINEIYSRLEEADFKSRKKTNSENDETRRDSQSSERRKDSLSTEDFQCTHKPTDIISFSTRNILRGKCLKHSIDCRSVYYGIDQESGENFIINEWKYPLNNYDDSVRKQISHIEQEFSYVTKFKHKNLALYHHFTVMIDENFYIVQVLKEFIIGSNCRSLFVSSNISADIPFIKFIANGVLQALDYLHKKNVIHRDIKDSCIYINNKGIVKISNYSVHKRLTDLLKSTNHPINYGKKIDVYKFGLFLVGLLQGSTLVDDENVKIPEFLPPDLYDFLDKCLCKEEKDRLSASQLLNHQFLSEKFSLNLKLDDKIENIPQEIQLPQQDYTGGSRNQSRIEMEFEFLEAIGEGAFGDVKKYKNKLDGRFYAIKRIKLNPLNKQLNKKIVREVQLLSRLNHENVVRYFNSWIETSVVDTKNQSISSETDTSFSTEKDRIDNKKSVEFTLNDDNIEELAPPIKNAKVSITYDSKSQVQYEDLSSDSESSEDEEENNEWSKHSESDGIEFEYSENENKTEQDFENSIKSPSPISNVIRIDYMYIQMQFCEKSTLKSAIDDNLYQDEQRVYRLFREILEGLAHIHQQGMIHRDLKPVNIFLDSKDHVKIGDFGLATTNLKTKMNDNGISKSQMESLKDENLVDESKTGHIGTPFYVAPELDTKKTKVVYNEKVDIYSLGIILFEMCYRPMGTLMERYETMEKLRKKEIIFPSDYTETLVEKHQTLIRWVLDHNTSKRPTSLELLDSSLVPPPILEQKQLTDLIRNTLLNPQTKSYKNLVASCFDQSVSIVQDITYEGKNKVITSKPLEIYYEIAKEITVKIFRKHGGQNLGTPLLMPHNKVYNKQECVKLMARDGGIVSLPYDLRVPFARYIVWNHISLLRRYSIERVYREKKVFGFIPRELYECAFDIVTPTPGNLLSDGEILYVVYEILTQLPVIKYKTIHLHLNHTLLLKSILLYYGIKDYNHLECIDSFTKYKDGKCDEALFQSFILNLGLSENQVENLFAMLTKNTCEAAKISTHFQMITRKNNTEYSRLAKIAIQELKTIIEIAKKMGFNMDIIIDPGLMYNFQQFSGMICQFVSDKRIKHHKLEVLAAGGRYDSLISHYQDIIRKGFKQPKIATQSAVGISISLDKIVATIQKEQNAQGDSLGYFDVLVCSIGNQQCLNEKLKVLNCLSNSDVRWTLLEAVNIKEVEEHREELKVPNIIILKGGDDGKIILRSWEKDRFQEKNYTIPELLDIDLNKLLKKFTLSNASQENVLSRSDSKTYVEKSQSNDSISIVFHTSEKMNSSAKKRYEIQISSQLNDLFKRLVGNVAVLVLTIDINIIKTLAATLEFQSDEIFQKSVDSVIERHPRYKKILDGLCDVIYEHKCKSTKPFLVLYSLIDSGYRLVT